ncbi:MAG: HAMP domain-containing sensor histidine kinase [Hyphomonadaceae bacterium]|nr:HAMP domain-containing sensor histidine kinase [Hyphomonadaceae bacterium]
MRGSTTEARIAEIESGLWIGFATLGAASTGGATAMVVLYAVAVAVAWMSGSARLTKEIAGFALLGLIFAIVANSGVSWLHEYDAAVIAMGYGVAGVVLIGVIAVTAVSAQPKRPPPVFAKIRTVGASVPDPLTVSKIKQMETRLQEATVAAEAAQAEAEGARERLEARTTFFAQTSHELRTPLNAIVGFAEMMRNAVFGPLSERYQEYAALIHEGGQNLTLIVDDVLDLARIEAGRYEIYADLVSLTDLASEAVHFMGDEAARKGIGLELTGPDDVEAFADSKAVRQIALNLISNALKFTPAGGRVEVAALDAPGGSLLAVSDTGAGISPEELTRLSRTFEQGEAGKRQKGAGLGLSVVRAFAELHGGRLDIESREGGGSTIAVFFPAEKTGTEGN